MPHVRSFGLLSFLLFPAVSPLSTGAQCDHCYILSPPCTRAEGSACTAAPIHILAAMIHPPLLVCGMQLDGEEEGGNDAGKEGAPKGAALPAGVGAQGSQSTQAGVHGLGPGSGAPGEG